MSSPTAQVRREAARGLGYVIYCLDLRGHDDARERLISQEMQLAVHVLAAAVLEDQDSEVRRQAADSLGAIGANARDSRAGRVSLPPLVQALADREPSVRRQAALALWNFNEETRRVIQLLRPLSQDRKAPARHWAACLLVRAGAADPQLLPLLCEAMHDDDYHLRSLAVQCLGNAAFSPEITVPLLVEGLADWPGTVSIPAAACLRQLGPNAAPAVPAILRLLDRKERNVRIAAFDALFQMGPAAKSALPALAAALHRPRCDLGAREVAEALAQIGPEAVTSLLKSLQHPDDDVRKAAANALADMGPEARSAAPRLIAMARNGDEEAKALALQVLRGLGPAAPEAAPLFAELGDLEALARIGLPAVPEFQRLLQAADGEERSDLLWWLANFGNAAKEVAPAALRIMRKDANKTNRFAAVRLLIALGEHEAEVVELLIEYLDDPEWQQQAIDQFAEYWGENDEQSSFLRWGRMALPALLRLLKHPSPEIPWRTAKAIWRIGPEASALPALLDALHADPQTLTPGFAPAALGRLGPQARSALPFLLRRVETGDWWSIEYIARIDAAAGKVVVPLLVRELQQGGYSGQRVIMEQLGHLGPAASEAVPVLMTHLEDEVLADSAAAALGQIGPAAGAAVPALTVLLKDEDRWLRWPAAIALTKIAPRSTDPVAALMEALLPENNDKYDPEEEERMWQKLKSMYPANYNEWGDKFQAMDTTRQEAAAGIGRIGPAATAAIPVLERAAKARHPKVRQAAVEALRQVRALK